LSNTESLTDFQSNAQAFIETINETREPILITVNGKVEAVLVDPVTYRQSEEQLEHARLVAAIHAGEQAVREGKTTPAAEVFAALKTKHGF
jgi:PHD/YefM family antitoxin component YafN of YafNO toxin-antitoxin module